MDIETLVKTTSRAWSLSILAAMHAGIPGRQAPLLVAIGAGRTALGHSLTHLVNLDLLERNPGHGHPLRPEYRLTPRGAGMSRIAHRITSLAKHSQADFLLRRAWIVPVLAVSRQPRYFGEIKDRLPPITDRALSQTMKQLHAHRWINREPDSSHRLRRPLYQAANLGAQISQALCADAG